MQLRDGERKIKPGRALFGVVGLKRVYSEKPIKITQEQLKAATKIEPAIYDTIHDFFTGKREFSPLPKYDDAETADLIFKQLTAVDAENNLAQFKGDPGGDEFAVIATAARNYLQGVIPRRFERTTGFGAPVKATASTAERLAFARQLATVEQPVWAIQQLLSATLTRNHIDALTAVWPDVLEAAQTAADKEIADRLGKDEFYRPARRVARQLAVLLGRPDMPNDFVQALQQEFVRANEDAKAQAKAAADPKPDDKLKTNVQRIADGTR